MKISTLPTASSAVRAACWLLLPVLGLLLLGGCAAGGRAGGGDLKKKVAVTAFENRTEIASAELVEDFHRQLTARLSRACSDTLLVTPEGKTFPEYLKRLPRLPSGLIDNLAFANTGRRYGLNAIATGNLLDIKIDEEAYGFWWFKGSRPYVELLVGVELLDTETGAKIIDERFNRKIKISAEDFESLRLKEARALALLTKPLREIADDVGESICDAVNDQPWKGYVITVLPDKVILSAGNDAGLVPGDILEVFDSGSIVSGYAGQQFFLPGLKVAEIRIIGVYPNRCEAEVVSGGGIREGAAVKPK